MENIALTDGWENREGLTFHAGGRGHNVSEVLKGDGTPRQIPGS